MVRTGSGHTKVEEQFHLIKVTCGIQKQAF